MLKSSLLLIWVALATDARAQSLSLIGELQFPCDTNNMGLLIGGSECWGWTAPDGTEYAIMGTQYGTHFVRVPDLTVVDSLQGPTGGLGMYNRDIETWRNYAFIVSEMCGPRCGMQVVDLSFLPDSVHLVTTFRTAFDSTAHNLAIDTANARAYIIKSNFQGVRIVDISNPTQPVEAGIILTGQAHDMFARNDTVWVAESTDGVFSLWECSNAANPVLLGQTQQGDIFLAHNIWPSADGRYFVTGEEMDNVNFKIWDATDMTNIHPISNFLGPGRMPHNALWKGNYIYCSKYEEGLIIINATDVQHPFMIHHYDNYPEGNSNHFRGCWGVYPAVSGGYVYGSTIEGRLSVLEFDPLSTEIPLVEGRILGDPFPVPASGTLHLPIQLSRATQVSLTVTDAQGRVAVLEEKLSLGKGAHQLSFDLSGWAAGLYSLRLQSGDRIEHKKFSLIH